MIGTKPIIKMSFSVYYHAIINSGIDDSSSIEKSYKIQSLNKFCFFTVLIASVYCSLFLNLKLYAPFLITFYAVLGFVAVIYFNFKKKYVFSKFLLITSTSFSVLLISLILGFSSGFHLYLYTSPLFVFWLFDLNEKKYIYSSFFIYVFVYILIFYFKSENIQLYQLDDQKWFLQLYSMNMIGNMILMFVLFFNYSQYYNLLLENLFQKQNELQTEVHRRIESENNTKQLFDNLSVSYKKLEEFGFVVSHNLRAPLANIRGFVSLYDINNSPNANEKIVNCISVSSENLENILSDLNSILKSKNDQIEAKEEFSINNLIDSVTSSLAKEITLTETIILKKINKIDTIFATKSILKSILYNVLQNSIKFKKENESAKVEVEFSELGDSYVFKISDNCKGIDLHKYRDRIFKLYTRFHQNIEGKGIGLYIVKSQVELLNGSIEIESELNRGTIFTITLPKYKNG